MSGSIGTSLQLQSLMTAHNQWLSKTRSIPYWTTSVFSSTVTDMVSIYESLTSSASVSAGLHSTAEHSTSELPSEFSYEWISWIYEWTLFYNFGRTE
jgi:hypothetical protein